MRLEWPGDKAKKNEVEWAGDKAREGRLEWSRMRIAN